MNVNDGQHINAEGLRLVEEEEAFIPFVYDDLREPRSATDTEREWKGGAVRGTLTIGYGTTAPRSRLRQGTRIDRATAELWLAEDMRDAEADVARLVKVPLNENQFGALVSFVYNVGASALETSTLLRLLNAGNYDAVPRELNKYVMSKGLRLRGLVRRRAREGALWSKPTNFLQEDGRERPGVLQEDGRERPGVLQEDGHERPGAVVPDDELANISPRLVPTEIDPETPLATVQPDAVPDKRPGNSKTMWSTGGGLGAVVVSVLGYITDVRVLMVAGVVVVVAAYLLIGKERIQRFFDERVLGAAGSGGTPDRGRAQAPDRGRGPA
jgi:GH24 family phage-related lysozyme (muramidase)